ncbi:MAG: hypothetical protein J0I26_08355, partial [Alphaproteobacteria bacterium]|nr:hypothetical protein [Alphaproteobacteria bacterium]
AADMRFGVLKRADRSRHIRQQRGVHGTVAKIFPQRFRNCLLMIDKQGDGFVQPFDTFLRAGRPGFGMGIALQI